MKKIFVGFIFVLLNFTIDIGVVKIGLIPNFVGYFLILKGIGDLRENAQYFTWTHPTSAFFTVYSLVIYILDLTGVLVKNTILSTISGVMSTIAAVLMMYLIVNGMCRLEKEKRVFLDAEYLKKIWMVICLIDVTLYISLLAPSLIVIFMFASLVATIVFLVTFYQSMGKYEGVF